LTIHDTGSGILFSCRVFVLIVKLAEVLGLLSQKARERSREREKERERSDARFF
jgi:hypothetical protein